MCVLEAASATGLDTSTHNSGVIHAGIYYPAGSLKARLCVEGRRLLYEFCAAHGVPHARCGKLIVAHDDREIPQLEALHARGTANGVEGLELVDRAFIARARAGRCTPSRRSSRRKAGIVNAEELVKTLLRSGRSGRRDLPARHAARRRGRRRRTGSCCAPSAKRSSRGQVVNAAGLYADDVSRMLGGETFTIYPCRGEYAELTPAKRSLVNALVYPLPHHRPRTRRAPDADDRRRGLAGTDGRYQERKDDYENDRLPVEAFVEPARRMLPRVTLDDLRLAGSGIRAEAAPAERVVRRLHDPPRPREPARRAGGGHRFAGPDGVSGGRRTGGVDLIGVASDSQRRYAARYSAHAPSCHGRHRNAGRRAASAFDSAQYRGRGAGSGTSAIRTAIRSGSTPSSRASSPRRTRATCSSRN